MGKGKSEAGREALVIAGDPVKEVVTSPKRSFFSRKPKIQTRLTSIHRSRPPAQLEGPEAKWFELRWDDQDGRHGVRGFWYLYLNRVGGSIRIKSMPVRIEMDARKAMRVEEEAKGLCAWANERLIEQKELGLKFPCFYEQYRVEVREEIDQVRVRLLKQEGGWAEGAYDSVKDLEYQEELLEEETFNPSEIGAALDYAGDLKARKERLENATRNDIGLIPPEADPEVQVTAEAIRSFLAE